LERKEFVGEANDYYVIEVPAQEMILYAPKHKINEIGVRPAMRRAKLRRVLDTLRSRPRRLPKDYRERQEKV
jgi:RNA polymerase-interacting CarD/CdnL/TRCF family regulator